MTDDEQRRYCSMCGRPLKDASECHPNDPAMDVDGDCLACSLLLEHSDDD